MRSDGAIETFDQALLIDRLAQEREGAILQCGGSVLLAGVCGYENDRGAMTFVAQMALQIEPAQTRHLQIRDQAGGVLNKPGFHELFCGFEGTRLLSERQDQIPDTAAGPSIVVDYGNHGVPAHSLSQDTEVRKTESCHGSFAKSKTTKYTRL